MKLKIYYGIKEYTVIEIPDEIHAVSIDGKYIMFIDDTETTKVFNVVLGSNGDGREIACRLQRGLPSTICKRSYASLKNANHIRITVGKETEK